MTPEQEDLLLKADKKLASAKLSLAGGFPEDAVSWAYYSMFYVAQAFVVGEGIDSKTHRGVIAAFGALVIKSSNIPRQFHRLLIDAERLRIKADYGPANAVTNDEAQSQIKSGEQFLELSARLIIQSTPEYEALDDK